MSPAELDALLEVARKHGVSGLSLGVLTVQFFPPEYNPVPVETDPSIPGGWKRMPDLNEE